jgi:glutamine amidotransferase
VKTNSIAIFDYGAGNLFSLKTALERNGAENVSILHKLNDVEDFIGLILPGVGNFDPAIKSVEPSKGAMVQAVENAIKGGVPILGICLGMEMLFKKSEEGTLDGLKILDGEVIMLPKIRVKIPHMGWNNIAITRKDSKLLRGVPNGAWVYFVHSYYAKPTDKSLVAATAAYGSVIPALVENGNLFGTQFHPEKSGSVGAIMIKNFLKECTLCS